MSVPVIVNATIIPADSSLRRYQATVLAEFDDGSLEDVVVYYDDELSFTAEEFVGLSREGASALHMRRDTAYLQS